MGCACVFTSLISKGRRRRGAQPGGGKGVGRAGGGRKRGPGRLRGQRLEDVRPAVVSGDPTGDLRGGVRGRRERDAPRSSASARADVRVERLEGYREQRASLVRGQLVHFVEQHVRHPREALPRVRRQERRAGTGPYARAVRARDQTPRAAVERGSVLVAHSGARPR